MQKLPFTQLNQTKLNPTQSLLRILLAGGLLASRRRAKGLGRQAAQALRVGVVLIALALSLSSCLGLMDCPGEFGTPSARARWCGPGSAGQ
ncbi:MAG: hypothetical protein QM537_08570 [Candidatus Symbiobacter sp.]|nr:hypothetical protein [Candidatus Symbiobacter sp.]